MLKILRSLKKILKWLLRFPADAFILSSKALPDRIDAHISSSLMDNPSIAAKFYPYQENRTSYVLLTPTNDDKRLCESELPIPPKKLWMCFEETAEEYLSSGREHVDKMMAITKASGFSFRQGNRILDFGCAAGRMTRWLKDFSKECEIWGVDIQADHIAWCQRHLSPPFRFATTTTLPHLPFEDHYFDFIYSGSVFTHISDLADAWLLELKRVLSPGGKLYITIHDKRSIDIILKFSPEHRLYWAKKLLLSFEEETHFMRTDFAMFTIARTPHGAQVFYDTDYFCQNWGRTFKILSVTQEAYLFQTAILLEK